MKQADHSKKPKGDSPKYFRLTIQSITYKERGWDGRRQARATCLCDCGRTHEAWLHSIKMGNTTQCGKCRYRSNTKHGESQVTSEWKAWCYMKYHHHGQVCKRWAEYANFLEDMGRKPSDLHVLSRKNPKLPFRPSNCHWKIRWHSKKWKLKYKGEVRPLAEWALHFGVNRTIIVKAIQTYGEGRAIAAVARKVRRTTQS